MRVLLVVVAVAAVFVGSALLARWVFEPPRPGEPDPREPRVAP